MNLYQIDAEIERLLDLDTIDPETGEVLDEDLFNQLQELKVDRGVKIENTALYIKNLDAEVAAIKAEEQALAARRKSKEAKAKWLRDYLTGFLDYHNLDGFESTRAKISFRKSETLEITNERRVPRIYKTYHNEVSIDKNLIKGAIKRGEKVSGVVLHQRKNIQIK